MRTVRKGPDFATEDPSWFVHTSHYCDWANAYSTCRVKWSGGLRADVPQVTDGICALEVYDSTDGVTAVNNFGERLTSSYVEPGAVAIFPLVPTYPYDPDYGAAKFAWMVTDAQNDSYHMGCRIYLR